jgi:2-polyprenyl-3-methyl-5-hydroxy-6-metoxy-1,4-benzoquinol methylase
MTHPITAKYESPFERARLDLLQRVVPQGTGTALDLGSGQGVTTNLLTDKGWTAVAIDMAPSGGPRPVRADVRRLPVRTTAAGLVSCLEVIEHVYEQRELLREIRRVLAPGGRLLLSTPNRVSLQAAAGKIGYTLARRRWDYGDPTHVSVRTSFTIARLLRDTGFVIDDVIGLQLIPHKPAPLHRWAYRWTSRRPWSMAAYSIVFIARRP